MAILEAVVIALAIAIPVVLVRDFRQPTRRAFEWGILIRKVGLGIILILLAITLLASGIGWMVLAGGVLFAILWTYLLLFTNIDISGPREVFNRWTR